MGFAHEACLLKWMARRKSLYCDVCGMHIRASRVYSSRPPDLESCSSLVLLQLVLTLVAKRVVPTCRRLLFVAGVWGTCMPFFMYLLYNVVVVGRSDSDVVHPPFSDASTALFGSWGAIVAAWALGVVLLIAALGGSLLVVVWDEWCTENANVFEDLLRPDPIPEVIPGNNDNDVDSSGDDEKEAQTAEQVETAGPPKQSRHAPADADSVGQDEATDDTSGSVEQVLDSIGQINNPKAAGRRVSTSCPSEGEVSSTEANRALSLAPQVRYEYIDPVDASSALEAIAHKWEDEREHTLLDLFGITGPLDQAMESTLLFFAAIAITSVTFVMVPMNVIRGTVQFMSSALDVCTSLAGNNSPLVELVAAYSTIVLASCGGFYPVQVLASFRIISEIDVKTTDAPVQSSRAVLLLMWCCGTLLLCSGATLVCRSKLLSFAVRRPIIATAACLRVIVVQVLQHGFVPLLGGLMLCCACREFLATPDIEQMSVEEAWKLLGPVNLAPTPFINSPLNPIAAIRALTVIRADVEGEGSLPEVCWNYFAYPRDNITDPSVAETLRSLFGERGTFTMYALGITMQRVWLASDRLTFSSCMAAGLVLTAFVWYNVYQLRLRLHHNVLSYIFPVSIHQPEHSFVANVIRLGTPHIIFTTTRNISILVGVALLIIEPGVRFARYISGGEGWPMIVALSSGSSFVDGVTLNLLFFGGRLAHFVALFHQVEGVDAFAPLRRLAIVDEALKVGYDMLVERIGADLDLHNYLVTDGVAPSSSADFTFPVRLLLFVVIFWLLLVGVTCLSVLPGIVVHALLALVTPSTEANASMSIHCIITGWCLVLVALQLHTIILGPLRRRLRAVWEFVRKKDPADAAMTHVLWLRAHFGLELVHFLSFSHTVDGENRVYRAVRLRPQNLYDSVLDAGLLAASSSSAAMADAQCAEVKLTLLRLSQFWSGSSDVALEARRDGFVLTEAGLRELTRALEETTQTSPHAKLTRRLLAGAAFVFAALVVPLWVGGGVMLVVTSTLLSDSECTIGDAISHLLGTWLVGIAACMVAASPLLEDIVVRRAVVKQATELWYVASCSKALSLQAVFTLVLKPLFLDLALLTFVPATIQFVIIPAVFDDFSLNPRIVGTYPIAVLLKRVYRREWQGNDEVEAVGLARRVDELARQMAAAPRIARGGPDALRQINAEAARGHENELAREHPAADEARLPPPVRRNKWWSKLLRSALGRAIDEQYLQGIVLHDFHHAPLEGE